MTKKDYVLSVLYRLLKYMKISTSISIFSMVFLVLFPIFYHLKSQQGYNEHTYNGLFIAFCVMWIVTYVICSIIAAIMYGRHIVRLPKIIQARIKYLAIITIILPYFTTLSMFIKIKNLTEKVSEDEIVLLAEQPDLE